jgi:N6-L-threonylcarbamoyladenine synthase
MGLDYPAGVAVDNLAHQGEPNYKLPLVYLDKDSFNFSFSGLKSAVINLINTANMKHEEINKADLASSFQKVAITVIVDKTIKAAKLYNVKHIVVAGGVAANRGLRSMLKEEVSRLKDLKLTFPSMKLCTDNAAMIAVAGYFKFNYSHL